MIDLLTRAGVLFVGLGLLLMLLLGARSEIASQEAQAVAIITLMEESRDDGLCINSNCVSGMTLVHPLTGSIDTFHVGNLNAEAIAYSPDYTRISYVNLSNYYILDLRTRRSTLIANDVDERYVASAWSPDSIHFAYLSSNGLVIVNVTTGERRRLASIRSTGRLEWSPDGTQLLFSGRPSVSMQENYIYTLQVASGELRNLTRNRPFSDQAMWSPDGSEIVFVLHGTQNRRGDLFIMNADGTNLRRLTSVHSEYIRHPRWVLNGTAIFYNDGDNYLFDLATGTLRRFPRTHKSIGGHDISPDGTQFVSVHLIESFSGDAVLTIDDFRTQASYDLPVKTYGAIYPEWGS